jgi:thiol-disulfide isomerase/thioredoxin
MSIKTISIQSLAGLLLVAGVSRGQDAASALARKPIQPNVKVSTPDAATCKVEAVNFPKGQNGIAPTGYLVRDGQGRPVRQFIDTTGKNSPNIVSFFFDGVESYREIDTNGTGRPDTFRYLGANGGRMGRDASESGTIDSWEAGYGLTAEETSQELYTALITRDAKRFSSLLATDAEITAIGLPAQEVAKLKSRRDGAAKRFAEAVAKLNLPQGAKWVHFEGGVPHTVPADAFNGQADSVRHKQPQMLIDHSTGNKVDLVNCGEMILVGAGRVWKLIDGPGDLADSADATAGAVPASIRPLVDELSKVPTPADSLPASAIKYHMARATILEQIVAKVTGVEQEPWLKQLIDAYTGAAEQGSDPATKRLLEWKDTIRKAAPKAPIDAYVAFRALTVEYAGKIRSNPKPDDFTKVQTWWKESLDGYLKEYPTAEDAPDAMMRLAMAHEFAGKDGETAAIAVCEKLATNFPTHPFASKATGIVTRLKSEGQAISIKGTLLNDGSAFDSAKLSGTPIVVHYWASWGGARLADEAKILADLEKKYAGKVAIVTVNLDEKSDTATAAIKQVSMPGYHVFQPGGIDANPLAVSYGILGTHTFLVGKDGKVVNKNAQLPTVGEEIEKLLK